MLVGSHVTHPFERKAPGEMLHIKARFVSTRNGLSEAIADDNEGMMNNLINTCEALTTGSMVSPGASKLDLKPISNHIPILSNANKVTLEEVSFTPILYQSLDSTVNDELTNSLESPTAPYMAYNMSQGRMTVPPSWYPNFFTPIITINGSPLYANGEQSSNSVYGKTDHKVLNMGYNLPYQDSIQKTWNVPVTSINVNAGTFQMVNVSGVFKYQRYPLYCEMDFSVEQ